MDNITGYQFDRMRVTPTADAVLYNGLSGNMDRIVYGFKKDCEVTASGLKVYVDKGAAIVQGRMIEILETITLDVPANSKGYVVFTVDLTQPNTSGGVPGEDDYKPVNNQVKVEVVQSLVNQKVNEDGKMYMFAIAKYTSDGNNTKLTPTMNIGIPFTFKPGWKSHDYYPIMVYAVGDTIVINGMVNNTSVMKPNVEYEIGSIPKEYAPRYRTRIYAPNTGSGYSLSMIDIDENGIVKLVYVWRSKVDADIDKSSNTDINMVYLNNRLYKGGIK